MGKLKINSGVDQMTNDRWFVKQAKNWLANNRFRLLFFIGLMAGQIGLLYVFSGLLFWYFYNERLIFITGLIIVFGLEISLLSCFLKDVRLTVRLWSSIPLLVITLVLAAFAYMVILFLNGYSPHVLVDSLDFQNRRFYLTLESVIYEPVYYVLYDCNNWGGDCLESERILADADFTQDIVGFAPNKSALLFITTSSDAIGILEGATVIFEYSLPQTYP